MQDSKGAAPFRHEIWLFQVQCFKTPQEVENIRHVSYASTDWSLIYAMLCMYET